jgi:flagella basal body P-ring formation protein FlgA
LVFFGVAAPKTVTAHAVLALEALLPVAARDLAKGDVIGEDDLTDGWVPLARTAVKLADTDETLAGRRLRRAVAAGQPIALSQVEAPVVVRRGQLVQLEMSDNGLAVTGQVKALGNGGYGQEIDAVYPATKKKLRVRVVDAGTVQYLR